jgi:Na+/H+-dicarboxylate symporter
MNTTHIVMRRIYYSYALTLLSGAAFWQGLLLGATIAAFGRLTHVAAIIENILATPLGNVPQYIYSSFVRALEGGEVLTVLVVVLMIGLSVRWLLFLSDRIGWRRVGVS